MPSATSSCSLEGAATRCERDVLSCVIADAAITDPEARILICLLQNAVGGIVRGLKVADLGRRCGMPEAKTSKTLHGLASKGYVRSRQERRYQPNTYEIPFLSSTGFKNEGAQSPAEEDGGSPSPPFREGLGAPPPAAVDTSGDPGASPWEPSRSSEEHFDRIFWPLKKLGVLPRMVWQMVHNEPADLSSVDIYLGYRWLTLAEGREVPAPTQGVEPWWSELEEFVRADRLDAPGISDRLRDAISKNPATWKHEDGTEECLLENELALIDRRFGDSGEEPR